MIKSNRNSKTTLHIFAITVCLIFAFYHTKAQSTTFKIGFGSCSNQNVPIPIFKLINQKKPDVFVFLGDNVYADTRNPEHMKITYSKLGNNPDYQVLTRQSNVIATWDDHDYGSNDAGRHFDFKEQSKQIFLDFFNEPAQSERRERPGIYTSYYYQTNNKTIQVILLDTRTFRDDLIEYGGEFKNNKKFFYRLSYSPYKTADSTLLGEPQWKWLEEELKKPADVRVIGSSIQFGITYNGFESWANFPHEKTRMLNLIKSTKANGVLFISGDVHYAELSKMQSDSLYPIFDVTSSGLTQEWKYATPNDNRLCGPVMRNNFGMLEFDFSLPDPIIRMQIWNDKNKLKICQSVRLSTLRQ